MAFPHPKSGEDHSRNDDEPNPGGVVWKSFERTIDIAEYRNGKDDVNPANNRTFGGIFHDEFVLRLSAISASFTLPAVGTPMGMSTELEELSRSSQNRASTPASENRAVWGPGA